MPNDQNLIWRFNSDKDTLGWTAANVEDFSLEDRAIKGKTVYEKGKVTPFLFSPEVVIDADAVDTVEFRIKIDTVGKQRGRIWFRKEGSLSFKTDDLGFADFTARGGGIYETVECVLSTHSNWNGKINQLRFDITYENGANFSIEWIKISDSKSKLNKTEWIFNSDGDSLGWNSEFIDNQVIKSGSLSGKIVYERGKKTPVLISPELIVNSKDYNCIELNISTEKGGKGRVWFCQEGSSFKSAAHMGYAEFTIPKGNGATNIVRCMLTNLASGAFRTNWTNNISQFRIELLYEDGVQFYLFWIKLKKITSAPGLVPFGNFETIDNKGLPEKWTITVDGKSGAKAEKLKTNTLMRLSGRGKIEFITERISIDYAPLNSAYDLNFQYYSTAKQKNTDVISVIFNCYNILNEKIDMPQFLINTRPGQEETLYTNLIILHDRTAFFEMNFSINKSGTETAYLDNIVLLPHEHAPSLWPGKPIWHADKASADTVKKPAVIYFRKTFILNNVSERAMLTLTANNRLEHVYINGKKILLTKNSQWHASPDYFDLQPYLVKGKNILALSAYGGMGGYLYGWLICDAGIILKNVGNKKPEFLHIKSDDSFLTSSVFEENWENSFFNDNGWTKAEEQPALPRYQYSTFPLDFLQSTANMVVIKEFILPNQIFIHSNITLKYSFSSDRIKENIKIYLSPDPDNQQSADKYCIYSQEITKMEIKNDAVVATNFIPPDYIPSGHYKVSVEAENAHVNFNTNYKVVITNSANTAVKNRIILMNGQVPVIISGTNKLMPLHNYVTGFSFGEYFKNMKDADINLYFIEFITIGFWDDEGKYDWRILDDSCARILSINPNARFVLEIPVDLRAWPHSQSVYKFINKYPNEMVKDENFNSKIQVFNGQHPVPSFASDIYVNEAKNLLTHLVRHVQKSVYGQRVIGYFPIGAPGGEWVYWGSHEGLFVDYSTPFKIKFNNYLKEKYSDIKIFNKLSGNNYFSFNEINMPSKNERIKSEYFGFLNPKKDVILINMKEFFDNIMSGLILEFADTVKKESSGNALFGTYYGYVTYMIENRESESGHFNLERMLNSSNIDFLATLRRYENRGIGSACGFMSAESSFLLHDKLISMQSDLRTHHEQRKIFGATDNLFESAEVIKREYAHNLISGTGFEFGYGSYGWIERDKRLGDVLKRCRKIDEEMLSVKRNILDGETSIAVLVDERATHFSIQSAPMHRETVKEQFRNIYYTGTGIRTFLLSDLSKMPEFKVYIFLNAYYLTEQQKHFINDKLKANDKTLVWIYAPGIIEENGINTASLEQVTGIKMKIINRAVPVHIRITNTSHPMTVYCANNEQYKPYSMSNTEFANPLYAMHTLGPEIIPSDGEILGINQNTGNPALSVKKYKTWTSVYSFSPCLPPNLLRGIAHNAGVHIASFNSEDTLYMSDNLIALHFNNGGKRKIFFPKNAKTVKELYSGQIFQLKAGIMEQNFMALTTHLFLVLK